MSLGTVLGILSAIFVLGFWVWFSTDEYERAGGGRGSLRSVGRKTMYVVFILIVVVIIFLRL